MADSTNRLTEETTSSRLPTSVVPEETLVNDARAGLTPAQMVERKLVAMLQSTILPASHLQVSRTRRALS
ncbi:MAG TPA: hypothetical protein VH643_37375 [Gemmataceae bacterium]|jgi:hypothetical protein